MARKRAHRNLCGVALRIWLAGFIILAMPTVARAQFLTTTSDGAVTITRYTGFSSVVIIPATINGLPVARIGDFPFTGRTSPSSISIPASVTSISPNAFASNGDLASISVDAQNPIYSSIGGVLFNKAQTILIKYPEGKSGSSYSVPDTVISLADGAFYRCTALTTIALGKNVASVGGSPFSYCSALAAVNTDASNPWYVSRDGVLFNHSQRVLVRYPPAKSSTSFTVPDGVEVIGDGAFLQCSALTGLTLDPALREVGVSAFQYCGQLGQIVVPEGVSQVGALAFAGCAALTNAWMGSGLATLGASAFQYCFGLTAVYFRGQQPFADSSVFIGATPTIYRLSSSIGWGSDFAGRPVQIWGTSSASPVIGGGTGLFGKPYGFSIAWPGDAVVVIEVCTNLAHAFWQPLSTNTIHNGQSDFTDPQWADHPIRLYRVRSP